MPSLPRPEKPSQGRDIAKVLGAKRQVEDGLIGPEITVTWCIGHLREAAPPEAYGEQYKQWSLEQLPIIPSQRKLEVKPKTAKQLTARPPERAGWRASERAGRTCHQIQGLRL